jgi:YVTN family beta-propeller protein
MIDLKTRTKHPTDIPVGSLPFRVAVTPNGRTALVTDGGAGTVSTIDVKTRTKHPTDIAVGTDPGAFPGVLPLALQRPTDVAVTPCHLRPRGTQSGT